MTALVILVSGCGDTGVAPAAQPEPLDDAGALALATSVVEASDARLPHLGSLMKAAREAIAASDDNAEAVKAFRRARRARVAANEAREAGDEDEATRLERLSYRFTLVGITTALGPQVATDALAGVDAAIARWNERVAGRDVPARYTRTLARVQKLADDARAQDSAVAGLARSLRAAELIRSLSPSHVARRALGHAQNVFRAARELVGDAATEDEISALRKAHGLLNRGREAYENKEWRNAIRAALASAKRSQGVIDGRGD